MLYENETQQRSRPGARRSHKDSAGACFRWLRSALT